MRTLGLLGLVLVLLAVTAVTSPWVTMGLDGLGLRAARDAVTPIAIAGLRERPYTRALSACGT